MCLGHRAAALLRHLLLGGVALWVTSSGAVAADRPVFGTAIVQIQTGKTIMAIPVEVAASFAQRQYGLMHKETLAPGTGMIFVFPGEGFRSFWMKNTLIPLDMLFFDKAGGLVTSHQNVEPLSLTARRSTAPAQYVLELQGGTVQTQGWDETIRLLLPVLDGDKPVSPTQ